MLAIFYYEDDDDHHDDDIQPKFNTITYGHNTIRYQGRKYGITYLKKKKVKWLSSFKKSIQKWFGPECH